MYERILRTDDVLDGVNVSCRHFESVSGKRILEPICDCANYQVKSNVVESRKGSIRQARPEVEEELTRTEWVAIGKAGAMWAAFWSRH